MPSAIHELSCGNTGNFNNYQINRSGQGHRQRRQQSGQIDQGGDTYQEGARQVDEQRRGVLPTLPHLRHPVRPKTER